MISVSFNITFCMRNRERTMGKAAPISEERNHETRFFESSHCILLRLRRSDRKRSESIHRRIC